MANRYYMTKLNLQHEKLNFFKKFSFFIPVSSCKNQVGHVLCLSMKMNDTRFDNFLKVVKSYMKSEKELCIDSS